MSEWPRMIYRKGSGHKLHGFDVDYRIVDNADEERAAGKEWRRTPAEAHGKQPGMPETVAEVQDENAELLQEIEELRRERDALAAEVAKVDPDGDGVVGGSKTGAESSAAIGAARRRAKSEGGGGAN